ncbi:TlpA family protein disulfide reductase [Nocardioides yefusunii]|uniref:TlpA family protein disulfide reductase n=1 Tax=Nocardioides yefusunii TaxID=2500546 RepID=A0ABW1QWV4_9ACTN|nr:TlpA disulfide reductase family protein [Nocardioides yefusunii]
MHTPHTRTTSRGLLGRVVVLLTVGVLALTGCSSLSTGEGDYVAGDGTVRRIAAEDRDEPIVLSGKNLDGEEISLADYAGKPVVVNVWWSACPPCRKEQPDLTEAAAELRGVAEFVGINIRDSGVDQAKGYQKKFDVPYDSFFSPDGKALMPFSGKVPPNAIPSTVILDAEGRAAASIIGAIPSKLTLVQLVQDVAGVEGDADGDADGGAASDG